ncbi:MAG: HAD hydrolase family protein, partial [Bacteroidota bacterium]
ASDTASTESVMLEFIEQEQLSDLTTFVLVQATSPFTQSKDFDQALALYRQKEYDSLLSCARLKRFFWAEDGHPINYDFKNRPRRQDFSGSLMENGAFYINSVANIRKYENRLSGNIGIYEMPDFTGLELDEEEDWILAEHLLKKQLQNGPSTSKKIKLLAVDVDGVLTDAGMYYAQSGDELKKFHTHDGKGLQIAREKGIHLAIITGEDTHIVKKRAEKLKIEDVYQGIQDKLKVATELLNRLGLELEQMAYIGDDINDLELLKKVGVAACPANAVSKVKQIPGMLILDKAGGEGAVRAFVEYLVENQHI